jgi:hypothetical protein
LLRLRNQEWGGFFLLHPYPPKVAQAIAEYRKLTLKPDVLPARHIREIDECDYVLNELTVFWINPSALSLGLVTK